MATSAIWKNTYRECATTLAPILMSFSRSVVIDQCLTPLGRASRRRKLPRLYARANNCRRDLIVHEVVAGKPCPLHRVLARLDPLLCRPAPVVEMHHASGSVAEVRDDEAHSGEQFVAI